MTLHRRAARRDVGERRIVEALRYIGAVVVQVSGEGVPDLLVGYGGRTWLLEVKAPPGAQGGTSHRELTVAQADLWALWHGVGGPMVLVRTPLEALQAIGVDLAGLDPGAVDLI